MSLVRAPRGPPPDSGPPRLQEQGALGAGMVRRADVSNPAAEVIGGACLGFGDRVPLGPRRRRRSSSFKG